MMYCIYCGRICDYHDSRTCNECRAEIARNNERVYLIILLLEAYPYISSIPLREKIEALIPQIGASIGRNG
jgi:hypothetical protein